MSDLTPLEEARRAVTTAYGSADLRNPVNAAGQYAQAAATLALAEEVAALRKQVADELGDGSLVQQLRDTIRGLPDDLSHAITQGMWNGRRR